MSIALTVPLDRETLSFRANRFTGSAVTVLNESVLPPTCCVCGGPGRVAAGLLIFRPLPAYSWYIILAIPVLFVAVVFGAAVVSARLLGIGLGLALAWGAFRRDQLELTFFLCPAHAAPYLSLDRWRKIAKALLIAVLIPNLLWMPALLIMSMLATGVNNSTLLGLIAAGLLPLGLAIGLHTWLRAKMRAYRGFKPRLSRVGYRLELVCRNPSFAKLVEDHLHRNPTLPPVGRQELATDAKEPTASGNLIRIKAPRAASPPICIACGRAAKAASYRTARSRRMWYALTIPGLLAALLIVFLGNGNLDATSALLGAACFYALLYTVVYACTVLPAIAISRAWTKSWGGFGAFLGNGLVFAAVLLQVLYVVWIVNNEAKSQPVLAIGMAAAVFSALQIERICSLRAAVCQSCHEKGNEAFAIVDYFPCRGDLTLSTVDPAIAKNLAGKTAAAHIGRASSTAAPAPSASAPPTASSGEERRPCPNCGRMNLAWISRCPQCGQNVK